MIRSYLSSFRFSPPKGWVMSLLCSVVLLFSATLCHARSVPPLEGLEALRRGFSGTGDFTAEITQEKRLSLMKRVMVMTGTVRFRKPDLFFMELDHPFASRMLLRDNVIEQAGRGGRSNRITLPPEQGLKRWLARLTSPVTSLPEGVVLQADLRGGLYTLTVTPTGKGQVKELVVSFQKDGAIRRLVISEQNGDRSVMTFRKVRRNVGLGEKDFRLEQ